MMNYLQLINSLKNKVEDFYVVGGEDQFLVSLALQKIYEACKITSKELDWSCFDEENFDANALLTAILQPPLLSQKRMIVAKRIPTLKAADKKILKNLTDFAGNTFVVVLGEKCESFDFLSNACVVDCKRLGFDAIKGFITKTMSKHNIKITVDGAKALCERCGFFMSRISTETEKLCGIVGEGGTVDENIVCENVKPEMEYEVFGLSNAICNKNANAAHQILKGLLQRKEDPQAILSLLEKNISRMLVCTLSKHKTNAELAKDLNVKEYAIKMSRENAKNFSAKSLKDIQHQLVEVDFLTKSGQMPFDLALDYVICSICN